MSTPIPTDIKLHRKSRLLEVVWADRSDSLPLEYLRVFSPSAEVRGHGGGEPMLVAGKREVNVNAIEPVGRYAVRLKFDDGHDSGLFSWPTLRELADQHAAWWPRYEQRLAEHGMSRDNPTVKLSALGVGKFKPVAPTGGTP
ncbi:MAG: 1-(5-phosphoribosyl)-5-((5-phosphoribosylamino)methylideneamino)imidazole-4-carboxamide isomerase [Xanthomonadaceae bacterium]|nr:1-(5-phosphoribosyl)-5-((5-phosphoribosylamino)methylideneamino)imidazole-4-carboxamide isomerase [Xanthomonadaceae bacterium]